MSRPTPKFQVGDQVRVVGHVTGTVFHEKTTVLGRKWCRKGMTKTTHFVYENVWIYEISGQDLPTLEYNLHPIPPEAPMTWEALRESLKSLPLEEQAA